MNQMRTFFKSRFFRSSDLGFISKKVFCSFKLIFYPLIQEDKILMIQWIRILNTDFKLLIVCAIQFDLLKFNNLHFYSVRFKKHRVSV